MEEGRSAKKEKREIGEIGERVPSISTVTGRSSTWRVMVES